MASLEALLKDLGMGENGGLDASEESMDGFFEKMMGQLMSKEVLYEPLKELSDKVIIHSSIIHVPDLRLPVPLVSLQIPLQI